MRLSCQCDCGVHIDASERSHFLGIDAVPLMGAARRMDDAIDIAQCCGPVYRSRQVADDNCLCSSASILWFAKGGTRPVPTGEEMSDHCPPEKAGGTGDEDPVSAH